MLNYNTYNKVKFNQNIQIEYDLLIDWLIDWHSHFPLFT